MQPYRGRSLPIASAAFIGPLVIVLLVGTVVFSSADATDLHDGQHPTDWGPMAAAPASLAIMEARAFGSLEITDRCVYLVRPSGDRMLLVWPADRSRWDGASQTITLTNLSGEVSTFNDGDLASIGGGVASAAQVEAPTGMVLKQNEWVAAPASSCDLAVLWAVGEGRSH